MLKFNCLFEVIKMKFSVPLKLTLLLALVGGTASSISLFVNNEKTYTPVSAAAPDSYYSSCTSSVPATLFSQIRSVVSSRTSTSYDYLYTIYADSDVDDQGYIEDIYSNVTKYKPGVKVCGNYSDEGDCWNREHSIPKSWWGGSTSNQGADPFIVYPSDGKVNGMRSNHSFGIVGTATYSSENNYSKLGSPKSEYSSGAPSVVFEPNDEWKGDLARAVFYACTAYSGSTGWTSGDGSKIFTSSGTYGLTTYAKNLFIKWHLEDPVSNFEANRNDAIYPHTNNRNPYIDHPEWVSTIWGESAWYEGSSEQTAPTSLTMNKSTADIGIGSTLQLRVTANSGASNSVSWSSTTPSVASVDASGLVTAKAEGQTTIVATSTLNSSIKAYCQLTVNDGSVDIEGVSADPISVKVGNTEQIVPVISPSDASPLSYSYQSTNTAVATVSSTGLVTGVEIGSTTITITVTNAKTNTVKSCVINVGVVEQTESNGDYVKVTDTADVEDGNYLIVYETGSVAFDGSLDTLDAVSNTIPVTISDNKITRSDTIDASSFEYNSTEKTLLSSSGYYIGRTANSNGINTSTTEKYQNTITISSGDANITGSGGASIKYNNASGQQRFRYYKSESDQQSVQLYKQGSASNVPVVGVKLDQSEASVILNETLSLTATVLPSDATNKKVTWSSSNTNVAKVTNGVVTGVSGGSATITVATEDGDYKATCVVTVVVPVLVENIIADETELELGVGESTEISINIEPNNATNQSVVWASSNTSVATVDQNGNIEAKAVGTATITVSAQDGSNVKETISVTVTVPRNTIKPLYDLSDDSSYGEFYGLYMGYYEEIKNSTSYYNLFIGSGDYAIMIYQYETMPTYTPYETYLRVSGGTLGIYSNLYEIKNCSSLETITAEQAESLVEPLVLYNVTGTEDGSTNEIKRVASRPVLVSGTVKQIVKGSFTSSGDTEVKVTLENGNDTTIFCKARLNNLEELEEALGTVGNTFTIRGFTSIYNSNFQIVAPTVVKADESYTAELFAQDLLEATNDICSDNGTENNYSALSAVWASLKMNKFSKLNETEIEILLNTVANSGGTDIENAMARYDHICVRYGLENFVGRSTANRTNHYLMEFTQSNYTLIITVSIISTALAVGAYLFLKNRKYSQK